MSRTPRLSRLPTLARREPLIIGASAPLLCAAAAALAVATAALGAIVGGSGTDWRAEGPALALLLAAGALLVVAAGPFLAPFRARVHGLVLALLLLALLLDEVARASGPGVPGSTVLIAVLLFQLPLAVLRPPVHVLIGGVVLALVLAGGALALARDGDGAAAAAVLVAALAPTVAAWVFGRVALGRLSSSPADPVPDGGVDLSVQQEAIARLEAEAVPLIDRVIAEDRLSADDAARARSIAAALRIALLADLARGWLAEAGVLADDPDGSAEAMTAEQRTALRTVFAALPLADPARPGSARISSQDLDVEAVLTLPLADRPTRAGIAPLIPLLRAAFVHADLRVEGDAVVLDVAYGLPRG